MKNGIYKVRFNTPGDAGDGLVTVHDGSINGGDSIFLYQGKMSVTGDKFTGKLAVKQWAPGNSVFGTVGQFTLDVDGASSSTGISGKGELVGSGGKALAFTGLWLSELA